MMLTSQTNSYIDQSSRFLAYFEFTWQIFNIEIELVSSEFLTCPLSMY